MNKNIFLRNLKYEDINKNYLSWFNNIQISKYIYASKKITTIKELKNYFLNKKKDNKVLFLAILNYKKKHIGNIKFEPIKKNSKKIYMGIMIGNKNYVNKGISKIIFKKAEKKFLKKFGIKSYYANVNPLNKIALNAYLKNNFKLLRSSKNNIELIKYL